MSTASQFYSDESSRNSAMERELARIVGEPLVSCTYGKNNKNASDGVWLTTNQDQLAYRLIYEGKGELCASKSEPTLQASLYYHGYWSQNKVCSISMVCYCVI